LCLNPQLSPREGPINRACERGRLAPAAPVADLTFQLAELKKIKDPPVFK
jgi:hypothetical protein